MFRITKNGASVGMTEAPTYIKQHSNGSFVLCPEPEASGIAFAGSVYHLLGAQRKSLRTASLSLVLSSLAFTIMQCFFATAEISTRETYFERYQDVWDIMVTVRGAEVDTLEYAEEIRGLPGVENAIFYQKAAVKRIVTEEEMSGDMKAFGGFSHASGNEAVPAEGGWLDRKSVV